MSPCQPVTAWASLNSVCDSAAEECLMFASARERIHWSFVDPAAVEGTDEERLVAFKRTVREMKTRLATFVPAAKRKAGQST